MSDDEALPTDRLKRPDALERLCEAIIDGQMMRQIALEWGVTFSRLRYWIASAPERVARVTEARKLSAITYDEKAEAVLTDAKDDLDLKRAKELAHHYRWKASKIDPAQYGEKIEHSGTLDVRTASEEQLARELNSLGLGDVARALLPSTSGDVRVH